MYEIIEKNQYGVLVKNTTNYGDCFFCKYEITQCNNRYKCINDSYYIPDSEAEKLESEQNIVQDFFKVKSKKDQELLKEMQAMVNNSDNSLTDAYTKKVESEMQVFYDTQKELIDLQIENKQLKERVKELEGTIENNVTEVSEFFNDGIKIFECNSCGMLMEENEPYDNYCPNCGHKIVR